MLKIFLIVIILLMLLIFVYLAFIENFNESDLYSISIDSNKYVCKPSSEDLKGIEAQKIILTDLPRLKNEIFKRIENYPNTVSASNIEISKIIERTLNTLSEKYITLPECSKFCAPGGNVIYNYNNKTCTCYPGRKGMIVNQNIVSCPELAPIYLSDDANVPNFNYFPGYLGFITFKDNYNFGNIRTGSILSSGIQWRHPKICSAIKDSDTSSPGLYKISNTAQIENGKEKYGKLYFGFDKTKVNKNEFGNIKETTNQTVKGTSLPPNYVWVEAYMVDSKLNGFTLRLPTPGTRGNCTFIANTDCYRSGYVTDSGVSYNPLWNYVYFDLTR